MVQFSNAFNKPLLAPRENESLPRLNVRNNSTSQNWVFQSNVRGWDAVTYPQVDLFSNPQVCVVSVVECNRASVFEDARSALLAATESVTDAKSAARNIQGSLEAVYRLEDSGSDRLASKEMMRAIENSIRRNLLDRANMLLAEVDHSRISSRTLGGMIRSTYRVKSELPAWRNSYIKSWESVRSQGKSPESTFMGLPKVEGL